MDTSSLEKYPWLKCFCHFGSQLAALKPALIDQISPSGAAWNKLFAPVPSLESQSPLRKAEWEIYAQHQYDSSHGYRQLINLSSTVTWIHGIWYISSSVQCCQRESTKQAVSPQQNQVPRRWENTATCSSTQRQKIWRESQAFHSLQSATLDKGPLHSLRTSKLHSKWLILNRNEHNLTL